MKVEKKKEQEAKHKGDCKDCANTFQVDMLRNLFIVENL